MNRLLIDTAHDVTNSGWMPFPGGELEGKPPRALCPACRARQDAPTSSSALCFQCYRVELERNRKLRAAADLDTASEARFQSALPFEPVDAPRLARLRVERQQARTAAREGAGLYIEKRRRAQIEARHTLARIVQGLRERRLADLPAAAGGGASAAASIRRGGDLQLPEAWLPFVAAQ